MIEPIQYMPNSRLEAMVAIAANGVIGNDQSLPWRLRSDLTRFRKTTMGHSLLMGRKTFESIGRPLPGRKTWILTRQTDYIVPGCQSISRWEDAMSGTENEGLVFLVGGANVYAQLLHKCRVLHITHVLADVPGDAVLGQISTQGYRCETVEEVPADEFNEYASRYEKWVYEGPLG